MRVSLALLFLGCSLPLFGQIAITTMPESSPTWPAGSKEYYGVASESSDPLAPWHDQSVVFRGFASGGSSERLNGAFLVYRFRIDFPQATVITSVTVHGGGDYGSGGTDAVLRLLDSNRNVLATHSTTNVHCCPPLDSTNSYSLNGIGAIGTTFFIDEFDYGTNSRFRDHIDVGFVQHQLLPNQGGNTGTVTTTLIGFQDLTLSTTVKLTGIGPDIFGQNVTIPATGALTTKFDLTGASPGARSVAIVTSTGTTTLQNGFTVEQGGTANLWLDVIAPPAIRPGLPGPFYVVYGNSGNVDQYDVPLFVRFPRGYPFRLSSVIGEGQVAVDDGSEILIPFWIYKVPAHSNAVLPLFISPEPTTPGHTPIQVSAELFQVPPTPFSTTGTLDDSSLFMTAAALDTIRQANILLGKSDLAVRRSRQPYFLRVSTGTDSDANCQVLDETLGPNTCHQYESVHNGVLQREREILQEVGNPYEYATLTVLPWLAYAVTTLASENPEFGNIAEAATEGAVGLLHTYIAGKAISSAYASATAQVITPGDPNDKIGPTGLGSRGYIDGRRALPYTITFENKQTASAAAQTVIVSDSLPIQVLDLSTFAFGPIAFGDQLYAPRSGAAFTTVIDLRPTKELLVRVTAQLNIITGVATWKFESLDPLTGQPTTDPLAGFLPPGVNGNVFFTVGLAPNVASDTLIQNHATVVFDTQAAMNTPTWLNTLDVTSPISHVRPLLSSETASMFLVQWQGSDADSGVQDYTVYASDNGSPYKAWLTNTVLTQSTFQGVPGHTYSFYSIARDLVGNKEGAKAMAEATTVVSGGLPGDVNGDGSVDCADITVVRAAFGKKAGDPGFDARADVNSDGVVDVRDLAFVSQHLSPGTKCQ